MRFFVDSDLRILLLVFSLVFVFFICGLCKLTSLFFFMLLTKVFGQIVTENEARDRNDDKEQDALKEAKSIAEHMFMNLSFMFLPFIIVYVLRLN